MPSGSFTSNAIVPLQARATTFFAAKTCATPLLSGSISSTSLDKAKQASAAKNRSSPFFWIQISCASYPKASLRSIARWSDKPLSFKPGTTLNSMRPSQISIQVSFSARPFNTTCSKPARRICPAKGPSTHALAISPVAAVLLVKTAAPRGALNVPLRYPALTMHMLSAEPGSTILGACLQKR